MKKLILFISLSLLILVGCSVKKDGNFTRVKIDRDRTVWINQDVECCGVKDPANNLEWFKKTTKDLLTANISYRTFLFSDTIISEDYIVIMEYKMFKFVAIYDCNGTKIGKGNLSYYSQYDYYDGGAYESFLRQIKNSKVKNKTKHSEQNNRNKKKITPPYPCSICSDFFKTHVLVDTISYFNKP